MITRLIIIGLLWALVMECLYHIYLIGYHHGRFKPVYLNARIRNHIRRDGNVISVPFGDKPHDTDK